ncbi:ABC transporter substrate-binding protein [Thalassovita aquimarina]|uniref:ABC transporter substrate-binding protein n=1 Tax=Thalassovita aquimarina TaxID=2785917 RepID=A0ABS5HVL3_9RHOB|nr:ABC transporter substrate-binding protein [Thalassovita aquimarina]MBR9652981.1 ABC transporter substrate-binding protein [Thalassovita aquimarina]
MIRSTLSAAFLAALFTQAVQANEAVTIEFAYPYSAAFDVTFEAILPKFKEKHPDIEIKLRSSYESYEAGTNTVLREAISGNLPDVSMQGLNRQRILVEKGIARSLEPFISKEADFETDGYHNAMLKLSTFDDGVYGLPFAVSLPVGYYNMDALEAAGVTELPKTWEEMIGTCQKLAQAGSKNPVYWDWAITGNWFLQSLMWTQGKPTVEGGRLTLDSPEALTALETVKAIVDGCEMKNLSPNEAIASFSAGELPMLFTSTSSVGRIERAKADFAFSTGKFPGIDGAPKGLPAGGNAAMLTSASDDPEVLEAAWAWLTYITSGEGAAEVAKTTGYMPPNKAANEVILADFYSQNPNKRTAVDQLPLLSDWQAYPGANGLAITQVIYDGLEMIVTGEADDMEELQQELVEQVNDLLPNG